jgi:hypothetical protein
MSAIVKYKISAYARGRIFITIGILLLLNASFGWAEDSMGASLEGNENEISSPMKSPPVAGPLAPLLQALDEDNPSFTKNIKSKNQTIPAQIPTPASVSPAVPSSGGMMDAGMMDMMGKMMGKKAEAEGKPSNPMQTSSAATSEIPEFAGVFHLYHLGVSGFFLDHLDMAVLTAEQQMKLRQLKESALLNKLTSERKINQAEQELWLLTGIDKPNIYFIEVKLNEIEKQKCAERLEFIRSVGEAAETLTPEQRSILMSRMSPNGGMNQKPVEDSAIPPEKKSGPSGSMKPGDM